MKATFSGTFDCKDVFWTYDFYLENTALIVNALGQVMFSCPETVVEISDENVRLSLNENTQIEKGYCKEQGVDEIRVSIKRQGKWRKAAYFTRESNEI